MLGRGDNGGAAARSMVGKSGGDVGGESGSLS